MPQIVLEPEMDPAKQFEIDWDRVLGPISMCRYEDLARLSGYKVKTIQNDSSRAILPGEGTGKNRRFRKTDAMAWYRWRRSNSKFEFPD